ncbi:MAG: hydroxysqualene dehydroxylase HpnE [Planctomycetota bacterium]
MSNTPETHEHVVVIGDGHAGVAAAVRLADLGYRVTVVESAIHVGQSTSGQATDNCQHALMRICTNQCDLYRRLGVLRDIDWNRTLHFTGEDGVVDDLAGDDLPAPFHLVRSLMKMKRFSWGEKLAIFRGFLSVLQVGTDARATLTDESFRDWLESVRQPTHVIDKFWAALISGACNQLPRQISAAYGIRIIHEAFLYSNTGYHLGFSNLSRQRFHTLAGEIVMQADGQMIRGVKVDRFEYDPEARLVNAVHLDDGRTIEAGAFVTALPHSRLEDLATEAMLKDDERLSMLARIVDVPIIGVHFYLDSPNHHDVMTRSHLIFTDGPIRWVFNKGREAEGPYAGTHHVHAVVAHAEDYAQLNNQDIIDQAFSEMRLSMPSLTDDVTVTQAHVVREKRAASSPRPGGKRYRPRPSGDIANLFIAGDWASTGWPTTREGAVRSGYRAAAAVTEMGRPTDRPHYNKLMVPDIQPTNLYAAMSG